MAAFGPVAHSDDRDHPFRRIATSAARMLAAPLDDGGDVSLLGVGQARREAVPVVNRRDRARRGVPSRLTQRRAREVPVDPPGRPAGWAPRSFLVSFCWLGWRTNAPGCFLRGWSSLGVGLLRVSRSIGGFELAHGRPVQFQPIGIVDDAIQDGVGERRVGERVLSGLARAKEQGTQGRAILSAGARW
jgi:hypothetical protein